MGATEAGQSNENGDDVSADFRAWFDAMPELGWRARADGFISFYNQRWYDYTGTTYESMQGWGWRDVHDPEMLPLVTAHWERSLRTGEPFEMQFPLRRHDGKFRWFLTRVSPLRDSHGVLIAWVGINTDVHESRESHRRSEESFKLLVHSVRDYAIYMLDSEGRVETWNTGGQLITGYAPEEILGHHVSRFFVTEDAAAGKPQLGLDTAALMGRFEEEGWRVRKDGSRFWATVVSTALSADDGTIVGFAKVMRDVTQKKAAEDVASAQRRALEERDELFKLTTDLIGVAGLDGFLKRLNPSWERTLGWSESELTSRSWLEFVHPEDVASTIAAGERLDAGESISQFQNRYVCKDGTYRWLDWRCVPLLSERLIYAIARDVTDERQSRELHEKTQRQLIVAERMVIVGTLAAGVAHEINNPLTYVTANVGMAIEEIRELSGGSPSGRLQDLQDMLLDAQIGCERVTKIVRGLKTFSRTDDELRSVIAIEPVLELSINMAFNEIRHRARLVKDFHRTPKILADDARLGQVFVNLLINAAQALSDKDASSNEIRLTTRTDADGYAIIEVRDTGPGIPRDVLPRIFDPFFTTKPVGVGTGLGLSISRNIVTGMGGEISVESTPGQGATFRVRLPPAAAATSPASPGAKTAPSPRRGAVLSVDDEPAVGIVLRRALRAHDVTSVTSAVAALELIKAGNRYDVILSDLMMPNMSGMELFKELSVISPEHALRTVFLTGGTSTTESAEFLDQVANERFEKPFEVPALRSLVEKFLR